MTVFDNRPDTEYIRSMWRGDKQVRGTPPGCGDDDPCSLCRPMVAERQRRRSPYGLRDPLPERDETKPPKDPRYAWLPP